MNYKDIITSITKKELAPVYFLMGDEPYYIDKLTDIFSNSILSKEEQEFNQVILYGKDTKEEKIISEAKQFPFSAKKRVVIVKEAQYLKNIEKLDSYLTNPQPNTVLTISYKNKSIDKRKKFGRNLNKRCIVFESNKLYDNQIPGWIISYVNEKEYKIDNSTAAILSEYLGNDLSKITNELDKLMLVLTKEETITTELVESYIGISKDYNIFELQNALGKKQVEKANRIVNYFSNNPKNYNIIVIMSALFSFFQKIMIFHFLNNKTPRIAANALKVNPFFITQYEIASKNYSKKQLFYIFEHLSNYDLRSKGLDNKNTSDKELLKELVFKILHS